MPNTLAHFGGQGPLARLTGARVDAKWVLLGCILPDFPWILRRLVRALAGGAVDPIGLRLYAIVQASLLYSLVLAGAVAVFAERSRPVFGVLGLGSLLHLLLDAAQTKWGNGVHLFAPASWQTTNLGWFWPESGVTLALTAVGVVYVGWEHAGRCGMRIPVVRSGRRVVTGALLIAIWLGTPPMFFSEVLASGSHSLAAIAGTTDRVGREVTLDRVEFTPRDGSGEPRPTLTVTGGEVRAAGELPTTEATVSVRGVFVDRRTLRVIEYHVHASGARDLASVVGLALLAAVWIRAAATEADERKREPHG